MTDDGMKARQPGLLAAVGAAHALLAWALLALGPGRSALAPRVGSQSETASVSVVLLFPPKLHTPAPTRPATTPAAAAPANEPAHEGPSRALHGVPRLAHARPAASDADPGSAEPAQPQRGGTPPAHQATTAPITLAQPAPPDDTAVPLARTELPASVSALADRRRCPPAPHPAALRERGIEGAVVLRVKVDVQGRPADVQVLAGSGWRLFDEAALQQVRACRFVPATQGGQAIDSWVEFPVRFALAG